MRGAIEEHEKSQGKRTTFSRENKGFAICCLLVSLLASLLACFFTICLILMLHRLCSLEKGSERSKMKSEGVNERIMMHQEPVLSLVTSNSRRECMRLPICAAASHACATVSC